MIKSIVLFVTFLAVVVAHPQGLWGMAKDDPLLLDLSSQALKLYNSEPKNSVELVEISHARATRQKDRVRFVLEVKGQECEECSCSEYYMMIYVNCHRRSENQYMFDFSEGSKKNVRKFNKC